MRSNLLPALVRGRIRTGHYASDDSDGLMGAFITGQLMILSSGPFDGRVVMWEHVSVSVAGRCPAWDEMCSVKNLFWDEEECVVQFHPPKSIYVNVHPYVLHLWKSPYPIQLPPRELIG